MAKRFYRPELDGLRFIAALLVLLHHSPTIPWLAGLQRYGWVGVDIFLVLSAYLITTLALLEYRSTENFDIRAFLVRRALRIWPLYFGFALAVCALSYFAGIVDARTSGTWAIAHLSFSANLLTGLQGYSPVMFSSHLWTIPLEEQAYFLLALLLPLILAAAPSSRKVLAICGVILFILTLARLALIDVPHPFVWTSLLRADPFILGAAAAIIGLRGSPTRLVAGILLISTIAIFPPIGTGDLFDVFGYAVVAAGATLVVVSAPMILGRARYLGKISYGLYVYHLLALGIAHKIFDEPLVILATATAVTIGISAASYQIYERPFLKFKKKFEVVRSRDA